MLPWVKAATLLPVVSDAAHGSWLAPLQAKVHPVAIALTRAKRGPACILAKRVPVLFTTLRLSSAPCISRALWKLRKRMRWYLRLHQTHRLHCHLHKRPPPLLLHCRQSLHLAGRSLWPHRLAHRFQAGRYRRPLPLCRHRPQNHLHLNPHRSLIRNRRRRRVPRFHRLCRHYHLRCHHFYRHLGARHLWLHPRSRRHHLRRVYHFRAHHLGLLARFFPYHAVLLLCTPLIHHPLSCHSQVRHHPHHPTRTYPLHGNRSQSCPRVQRRRRHQCPNAHQRLCGPRHFHPRFHCHPQFHRLFRQVHRKTLFLPRRLLRRPRRCHPIGRLFQQHRLWRHPHCQQSHLYPPLPSHHHLHSPRDAPRCHRRVRSPRQCHHPPLRRSHRCHRRCHRHCHHPASHHPHHHLCHRVHQYCLHRTSRRRLRRDRQPPHRPRLLSHRIIQHPRAQSLSSKQDLL
mmetsp:Transcript_815/g.2233  ORF Transcript_815/g.2233 Transcript_815/m.2233 type:complete len:454 (+) Transcript_815:871-2232(+)